MHRRTKSAGDRITYRFQFARAIETLWQPGTEYTAGDWVRPPQPNGYEYLCDTGGQSAQDEPDWNTALAGSTNDGSVVWTTSAFSGNARDAITGRVITPDDGIDIVTDAIDGDDITVTIEGGTVGQCYDILCEANTAAGEQYTEKLRLTITE